MRISLKLRKFIVDLLECNTSLIWNLVPFRSIMFAFPKPSTKLVVPYMILSVAFVKVKSKKYILSRRIVCMVTQSARHTVRPEKIPIF